MVQKTVRILPDVLSQEVGAETVMLNLNNENYFGLDETGTRIWQLIQEHGDLNKVYDTMVEEYGVDEEQLKIDLNELINKLVDARLVSISET